MKEDQRSAEDQIAVEEILELFRKEVARDSPVLPSGCVVAIAIVTGLLTVCSVGTPLFFVFLLSGGLIWLLVKQLAASKKDKEIAKRLAQHKDVRMVGPLLGVFAWPEHDVQTAARQALLQILPRLKASDAKLLNADHRRILHRILRTADYRFITAVLKALEQVGDESSVPHVERLTNRHAWWPENRVVRDAARECLPALRTRLQSEGHALLRPTEAASASHETLLRSARNTYHPPKEELLRPSTDETPQEGYEDN